MVIKAELGPVKRVRRIVVSLPSATFDAVTSVRACGSALRAATRWRLSGRKAGRVLKPAVTSETRW